MCLCVCVLLVSLIIVFSVRLPWRRRRNFAWPRMRLRSNLPCSVCFVWLALNLAPASGEVIQLGGWNPDRRYVTEGGDLGPRSVFSSHALSTKHKSRRSLATIALCRLKHFACNSMDGPDCMITNGRDPPKPKVNEIIPGSEIALQNAINEALQKSLQGALGGAQGAGNNNVNFQISLEGNEEASVSDRFNKILEDLEATGQSLGSSFSQNFARVADLSPVPNQITCRHSLWNKMAPLESLHRRRFDRWFRRRTLMVLLFYLTDTQRFHLAFVHLVDQTLLMQTKRKRKKKRTEALTEAFHLYIKSMHGLKCI